MKSIVPEISCYDAIAHLDEAAKDILQPGQRYYVLGGIAAGAIGHEDSVFDHQSSSLIAASNSAQSNYRDENGTLRDVDFLIFDQIEETEANIHDRFAEAIDHRLVVSVFGIKPHQESAAERGWSHLIKLGTSERTIDREGRLYYEMFPIVQEVPASSYTPWRLEMPNGHFVPILNLAAQMLAYKMRTPCGVRPKDREKYGKMERAITADPIFTEQINDGDLRPWADFADRIEKIVKGSFIWQAIRGVPDELAVRPSEIAALKTIALLIRAFEPIKPIAKLFQEGQGQELLKKFNGAA